MNTIASMTIGTQITRDGGRLQPATVASLMDRLKRQVSCVFGGCTFSMVSGCYIAKNGSLMAEESAHVWVVIDGTEFNRNTFLAIAQDYKALLKQESVLVTFRRVDVEFV